MTTTLVVEHLVERLAKLTGESVDTALETAVRERLERVDPSSGLAERLMEIGRKSAPLWEEPYKSMDHGDLLYDEQGLPK